jgi:hypothetical protein
LHHACYGIADKARQDSSVLMLPVCHQKHEQRLKPPSTLLLDVAHSLYIRTIRIGFLRGKILQTGSATSSLSDSVIYFLV